VKFDVNDKKKMIYLGGNDDSNCHYLNTSCSLDSKVDCYPIESKRCRKENGYADISNCLDVVLYR
jgi:hypothetical protein